jgi:hypothetical protein
MAMEDAERAALGRIEFRVDSTAVVTYVIGKSPHLEDVRHRIHVLLKHHPEWKLALVKRKDNMRANALARLHFGRLEESAGVSTATPCSTGGRE